MNVLPSLLEALASLTVDSPCCLRPRGTVRGEGVLPLGQRLRARDCGQDLQVLVGVRRGLVDDLPVLGDRRLRRAQVLLLGRQRPGRCRRRDWSPLFSSTTRRCWKGWRWVGCRRWCSRRGPPRRRRHRRRRRTCSVACLSFGSSPESLQTTRCGHLRQKLSNSLLPHPCRSPGVSALMWRPRSHAKRPCATRTGPLWITPRVRSDLCISTPPRNLPRLPAGLRTAPDWFLCHRGPGSRREVAGRAASTSQVVPALGAAGAPWAIGHCGNRDRSAKPGAPVSARCQFAPGVTLPPRQPVLRCWRTTRDERLTSRPRSPPCSVSSFHSSWDRMRSRNPGLLCSRAGCCSRQRVDRTPGWTPLRCRDALVERLGRRNPVRRGSVAARLTRYPPPTCVVIRRLVSSGAVVCKRHTPCSAIRAAGQVRRCQPGLDGSRKPEIPSCSGDEVRRGQPTR